MRLRFGFLSLVAFLACSSAFGQALVDGRIIDGNPFKPVAGYEVHLVNKDMKVDTAVKTDSNGRYSFDDVVPAEGYAVDVYDLTGNLIGADSQNRFILVTDGKHTAVPDIDIQKHVSEKSVEKLRRSHPERSRHISGRQHQQRAGSRTAALQSKLSRARPHSARSPRR